MDEATTTPVDVVLATNVARLRQDKELSQAQLARAVSHHGLAWTRATVAQVETGGRALSAKEVLVLAAVFGTALATLYKSDAPVVMVGDAPWSARWYAAVLAGKQGAVPAKLRPRSPKSWDHLRLVQRAIEDPTAERQAFRARWDIDDMSHDAVDALFFAKGDAEQKAARRISDRTKTVVAPSDVAAACTTLWGRQTDRSERHWPELWTFTDERDRRVAARGGDDIDARRLQALRGRVVREMDRELKTALLAAYITAFNREDRQGQKTENEEEEEQQ